MKLAKTIALCVLIIAFFESCKRETPVTNEPEPGDVKVEAKDIVTPPQFNFETEKELSIRVKVATTSFPGERFAIKIYANVPSTGALITTGITSASTNDFSTKVTIPAWEEYIYIEKVGANGSSEFQKVKASQFIAATFTGKPDEGTFIFPKSGSGMDCNTGCSSTQNNTNSYVNVSSGQTYCFTGTMSGANINVSDGGIVKICASGSISALTLHGTAKAYILENTVVSLGSLSIYSGNGTFKNWSDSLTISGGISVHGDIENHGKWYIGGAVTLYASSSHLKNYGTLSVGGSFAMNDRFKNYGKTTIGGSMDVYSGSQFNNYCELRVAGNMANSATVTNSSLIKVVGDYNPYASSNTTLENGALLSVKNITLSGTITGNGTNRSVVKVKNNSTMYNSSVITGKIDWCDSTGLENNQASWQNTAAQACTAYIATSTCNTEGFGQPTIQDADGDGIADAQDEYPNDADRAFNSYYPAANTTATLAFEDLWPTSGDYDYNDLVLAFNVQKVLNADYKVVDYKVKLKVKAIGASYDNGFGFRLDEIMPNEVASVAGQVITKSIITRSTNNTEAGQDRAVIICYDSPEPTLQRAAGSMFNTIKTNGTGTSDTVRVDVTFASPVDDSKLDISKFNPFIFTNQRRDYEVHLGNFKPTSLANTNLFGTERDRSVPSSGIYYKTANGMPWAIILPTDFAWPAERTAITTAYNYFDDWAVSGGTGNTSGWYTNNPGNRNTEHIY